MPSHDAIVRGNLAVLVVDAQNDVYALDGLLASRQDCTAMAGSIRPQVDLVQAASEAGVMVVFLKIITRKDHITDSPAKLYERYATCTKYHLETEEWNIEGTWGSEVYGEIREAAPSAIEVVKDRASGFVNTNLDLILRSNEVSTIIVTGMATDGCVAATARDACDYGYKVIIARDAVGSFNARLHGLALNILASRMNVLESAEIIEQLRLGSGAASA